MFKNKKGRFWYLPISFILMNLGIAVINAGNVMGNKPIVSFDYSFGFIGAMLGIAIVLEFVYLFVDKMVME